ncbi:MAG TPA: DMT family protein [Gemmatimonadaceae bacterium]|nr:DMT family protein [Gemmatimonadaceae bacterium]
MTLPQLRILQEVITLSVFVPSAVLYMRQPVGWNYATAAACVLAAVWLMFRG